MEKATMVRIIRILEFIGELKDEFRRPLVVKYSGKADSPLQSLEKKLDNKIKVKQHLKLTQSGLIFHEGSKLNIEIHKYFRRPRIFRSERTSQDDSLCKASIKFDDLWDHLASEAQRETDSNFEVELTDPISGLQFWIVAEAYGTDLHALDAQIKSTVESLKTFKPLLSRLSSANTGVGMLIELGKAISVLNSATQTVVNCIDVVYKHFEAQKESHEAMQDLAEGMSILAGQLDRLKEVPKSDQLRLTISGLPGMMEEVVDFIEKWLESWSAKHILVVPHKGQAIELRKKIDTFAGNFDRDLLIEIRLEQAMLANDVKIIRTDIANAQENTKTATEKKELDDLVGALGENRLPLRESCMEGTRIAILQEVEYEIKNVDGPNVIWIRGSPGVGKSALAASIANRLEDQKRHVISFRFERTQSTITTNALWRTVACDLARLYPSLRQHLAQGNQGHSSSDIDRLFKSLIEVPLSQLDAAISREELPVIVIDALDECGGLRHDPSGRRDYEALLSTLRHWVQADHLKKFKLVITSRPEDHISRIFPESISIHINIPSGSNVKLGDHTSHDIRVFLKSRLDSMGEGDVWIKKALDRLVPRAAGIFIWATTVADFLEVDPRVRFVILESKKRGDNTEGLDELYLLYLTVVEASFGRICEEEIKGIVSVMGAMIFAKQPLSDDVLLMLPGVRIGDSDILRLIRKGLMSVLDSGPVLHFHHRSFEDFLLSLYFRQELHKLSGVWDRELHERQLALLCLKAMVSSELHFNMGNLDSSSTKNVDIDVKSAVSPLISYSSLFWVDHLIQTPFEEKLMEAMKFIMYEKLLFWLEVMSLTGDVFEAYLIMKRAFTWKSLNLDHELTLFIHDALRFISAFIIPISQRASHVYLSVLPFAPEQSRVARKFRSRFPNTHVVTQGKPSQWPMVVFTAEHHKHAVGHVVFSLDEITFASISEPFETMCICDSETGHRISGPFELSGYGYGYGARFSPDGKHILLKFNSYAAVLDIGTGEEQFQIKGSDFVFINHDGRIASMCWVDEDGNLADSEDESATRILVQFWDTSNGALMSDRPFEANDVTATQFSPDGRLLAVGRKSEDVIELWNLEGGKDPRRFPYFRGKLSSLHFSPTGDSLMAICGEEVRHVYLWRLDTQEMVSFSHDFDDALHAIHSPLTNCLFIERDFTVEIWDVSMTGSKMIWKTKPPATSYVRSICPSRNGHRLLVGYEDGSVRMWDLDLEELARNQADTIDTQDDTDMRRVITLSHSGKMVVAKSQQSSNVEFLDTTTGEVIARTDIGEYKRGMKIAFSPDEEQVAFLSKSFITIYDIMHPEERVSFDPWPRKDVWNVTVAFQTCNDLVICTTFDDYSGLLQVWHRQDPAGFECMYSLDIKDYWNIILAPDGLTVIMGPPFGSRPITCYSWNHDTAQFDPVHFDDQVHIRWRSEYSPDGKLLACWSPHDFHVRVWDTQTRQLVSKFPTSEVDGIALSPALIEHSLTDRLIALRFTHENAISLFDAYTGHLYTQIMGQADAYMTFMRDGTKLAYYSPDIGLRIWDIADLTDEHRQTTDGHELIMQGMMDGWVMGQDDEPLFWVPVEHREHLYVPPFRVVIEAPQINSTILDLSNSRLGRKWTECIDKEWLRELEKREKEVGNLLE